jgi:hypothetical protein
VGAKFTSALNEQIQTDQVETDYRKDVMSQICSLSLRRSSRGRLSYEEQKKAMYLWR